MTTEHCPAPYETKVEGENNDVVLPAGTLFCVKASNEATEVLVADGETALIDYVEAAGIVNHKGKPHDVSYYVTYEAVTEEPEPETPPVTVPPVTVPPTVYECAGVNGAPGFSYNDPTDGVCDSTEVIHEDDPRWDCATMGNKICGPTPEAEASTAVELDALAYTGTETVATAGAGLGLILVGAALVRRFRR